MRMGNKCICKRKPDFQYVCKYARGHWYKTQHPFVRELIGNRIQMHNYEPIKIFYLHTLKCAGWLNMSQYSLFLIYMSHKFQGKSQILANTKFLCCQFLKRRKFYLLIFIRCIVELINKDKKHMTSQNCDHYKEFIGPAIFITHSFMLFKLHINM